VKNHFRKKIDNIPKVIHYFWFGGNPLPELTQKCIKSWRKNLPGYEVFEWNEETFDINSIQYTKEAYKKKKFAFVSDYVRLYALTKYGGIYMDSDYEIVKPIDFLLNNQAFAGFENKNYIATAIIGSIKEQSIFVEFMDCYKNKSFILEDGSMDMTPNVDYFTDILNKYGLKKNNKVQNIKGVSIYPTEVFSPVRDSQKQYILTDSTCGVHHFVGSWISDETKKAGKKFWWKYICRPLFARVKIVMYKLIGKKRVKRLENKIHNYVYKIKR